MAVPEPPPETIEEYEQLKEADKQEALPVSAAPADIPLPIPEEEVDDGLLSMACAACAGENVESNWVILKQDLDRVNGCPFCLRELSVQPIPAGEIEKMPESTKEAGADEAKYHKRIG